MNKLFVFTLLVLLSAGFSNLSAQQDSAASALYKITLSDGSELFGTVQSESGAEIKFTTVSKVEMTISKHQIRSMEKTSNKIVNGEIRRSDPNKTRLFFAPTARSLKSGQGYFSDYELFFPMIAVGVGNVVTLAGGVSLIPGASGQAIYLAPKVTPLHVKNADVAAGVLYISIPDDHDSWNVGIAYGVGTYGTDEAALTFGLGWGFTEGDFANKPIVLLGGELRLSNSVKLISENWIPPSSDFALASIGIRFFGDQLAADLALVTPLGARTTGFPFMPWVGFVYNFGM